jgi:hypothetical protein
VCRLSAMHRVSFRRRAKDRTRPVAEVGGFSNDRHRMTDLRQRLIRRIVDDAFVENGELYLGFGDQWRLAILNPFQIEPGNADDLVGAALLMFEERGKEEVLQFDTGVTVKVDMRDEAYRGPEAIVLSGPKGLLVVWN